MLVFLQTVSLPTGGGEDSLLSIDAFRVQLPMEIDGDYEWSVEIISSIANVLHVCHFSFGLSLAKNKQLLKSCKILEICRCDRE